jgi:hypothetical protein
MLKTLRGAPRLRTWAAFVVTALAIAGLAAASPAAAQSPAAAPNAAIEPQALPLPSPLRFVSNVDLECFRTSPYTPPLTTALVTRHLNPVLATLPVEPNPLGVREKLCVPVAKNNVLPPPGIIDFVRFVDLSCYRTTGINVNLPLNLRHLNPLLTTLPPRNVVITTPQHLCVPVVKNGVFPPAEVRQLVSYIDLKCYAEQPPAPLNLTLNLRHLNPVFTSLAAHNAVVTNNRQLCVPVQKNNQPIPPAVLNIVRWLDLEMFDIVTPALPVPVNLTLTHINPLLANLPSEPVTIQSAFQLGLPMAKNGLIPPTV